MAQRDVLARLTLRFHQSRVFVRDVNNPSRQWACALTGLARRRAVPMYSEALVQPILYELEVGVGISPAANLPASDNASQG